MPDARDPAWAAYCAAVVPGLRDWLVTDRLGALLEGIGAPGPAYGLRRVTEAAIRTWASWLTDEHLTEVGAELGLCLSFGAWQGARAGRKED